MSIILGVTYLAAFYKMVQKNKEGDPHQEKIKEVEESILLSRIHISQTPNILIGSKFYPPSPHFKVLKRSNKINICNTPK